MFRGIQVAGETDFVSLLRDEFRGIADIFRRGGSGMFGARSVAGFTAMFLPAATGIGIDNSVRAFPVVVPGVFVAGLAGPGANVLVSELFGRWGRVGKPGRYKQDCGRKPKAQAEAPAAHISTVHAPIRPRTAPRFYGKPYSSRPASQYWRGRAKRLAYRRGNPCRPRRSPDRD